ncbi:hypothetical protein AXX16_3516 [Serratia rubidaea]|nr:hypothetical protein AXX16_3516 [Serratia rubidaea]
MLHGSPSDVITPSLNGGIDTRHTSSDGGVDRVQSSESLT